MARKLVLATRRPRKKGKTVRQATITATLAELARLEPASPKATQVIALLSSWLGDESGYDEEAWPQLKQRLDRERSRVGARRLFDG